jgi:hypothetical protein
MTELFLLIRCLCEGELPSELGDLNELNCLSLGGNRFTGPLPQSLLQCQKLTEIYIESQRADADEQDNSFDNLADFSAWLDEQGSSCTLKDFAAWLPEHTSGEKNASGVRAVLSAH